MSELVHPTAERIACAGLLRGDTQALELAQALEPHEFSSVPLQVVVEACKRVLRGIEPVDAQSIVAESMEVVREWKLKSVAISESFVLELMREDTARAEPYSHTVKRMHWLREFAGLIEWGRQELSMMPDPDELFTAAQERMQVLKPKSSTKRFVHGWDTLDYTQALRQRMAKRKEGKEIVFPWPWYSWRNIALLRAGMVGFIGGAQGTGKSAYLEEIAEHWAGHGHGHVVFVHCENNLEYTKDRRMARHTGIDITKLELEDLNRNEWGLVQEAEGRIAEFAGQLHYFNAANMNIEEILRELDARVDEGTCDAVVLDYLNKIRPTRGQLKAFDKDYDRAADSLDQFKNWCEERVKVGVTAGQLTKGGKAEEGRLDSTHVRGSGEIADKVQLLIMTQRPILEADLLDKNRKLVAKKGEKSPEVTLYVEKQNRGRDGFNFKQKYIGAEFRHDDIAGV